MEFLIFRLPNEEKIRYVKNQEAVNSTASFFPFDKGENFHIFCDEISEIKEEQLVEILENIDYPIKKTQYYFPKKEEYLDKIGKAIEYIEEYNLQKLVVSRPLRFSFDRLNLAQTFLNLCKKYPQSFCYIWKSKEQLWLGASPEILGIFEREKNTFETMSLAGTLPINEEWTGKEIEEQYLVTSYILGILGEFSEEIEIKNKTEHVLGKIKHLKNEIKAKVSKEKLNDLIEKLHPTPAVCGIPKEFCQQKILEIEQYSREFYSGYIKIDTPEKIYFFVNIRCMQIFSNEAVIYVGGGITSKSNLEKEWKETELKSQVILESIVLE